MTRPGAELPGTASGVVDRHEAVAAVARVMASDALARSPRSRDFFAFVSAEAIAGRAERLHEGVIGRRALGKGPTFDGRSDPGVRVQAHRLRVALDNYYRSEGRDDRVVVSLPCGQYAPVFTRLDVPEALDPTDAPTASVGVVRFSGGGDDDLSALLLQGLVHRLSQVPDLLVSGPSHRREADTVGVARDVSARYLLRGGVTGPELDRHAVIFLLDGATGEVLWSGRDRVGTTSGSWPGAIDEVAAKAAAQLGDYAGVIIRRELMTGQVEAIGARARIGFYRYIVHGGAARLSQARLLVDGALAAGATAADLHAMSAFLNGIGVHHGLSPAAEEDLARATDEARRALRDDPRSALAHVALALVAVERGERALCRSHALRAVEMAPAHPSTLFSAGAVLAKLGEWDVGCDLMRRSFALNPLHPAHQHANLAVERLLHDDFAGALREASIVDEGALVWGPLCRALAHAGLGRLEDGRREIAQVEHFLPHLRDDPGAAVADLCVTEDQRSRMVELLRMVAADH